MTAASSPEPGRAHPLRVAVTCGVCGDTSTVTTRRQFARFEERHTADCAAPWVAFDVPLDDVLDLPPH